METLVVEIKDLPFTLSLIGTFGNVEWMKKNEDKIKAELPETWTHIKNKEFSPLALGFTLKVLGVDWRSEDDLVKIMLLLEQLRIVQREGSTIRRSPDSIFEGGKYE